MSVTSLRYQYTRNEITTPRTAAMIRRTAYCLVRKTANGSAGVLTATPFTAHCGHLTRAVCRRTRQAGITRRA